MQEYDPVVDAVYYGVNVLHDQLRIRDMQIGYLLAENAKLNQKNSELQTLAVSKSLKAAEIEEELHRVKLELSNVKILEDAGVQTDPQDICLETQTLEEETEESDQDDRADEEDAQESDQDEQADEEDAQESDQDEQADEEKAQESGQDDQADEEKAQESDQDDQADEEKAQESGQDDQADEEEAQVPEQDTQLVTEETQEKRENTPEQEAQEQPQAIVQADEAESIRRRDSYIRTQMQEVRELWEGVLSSVKENQAAVSQLSFDIMVAAREGVFKLIPQGNPVATEVVSVSTDLQCMAKSRNAELVADREQMKKQYVNERVVDEKNARNVMKEIRLQIPKCFTSVEQADFFDICTKMYVYNLESNKGTLKFSTNFPKKLVEEILMWHVKEVLGDHTLQLAVTGSSMCLQGELFAERVISRLTTDPSMIMNWLGNPLLKKLCQEFFPADQYEMKRRPFQAQLDELQVDMKKRIDVIKDHSVMRELQLTEIPKETSRFGMPVYTITTYFGVNIKCSTLCLFLWYMQGKLDQLSGMSRPSSPS
jgi:hypothetical protein